MNRLLNLTTGQNENLFVRQRQLRQFFFPDEVVLISKQKERL